MWTWGTHSLFMSAPAWQACKISVYIIAWQQYADISISHVTPSNNPVRNILQSILMTFYSPQSCKVTGVGDANTPCTRWNNFNGDGYDKHGFILSCSGQWMYLFFFLFLSFWFLPEWTTYSTNAKKQRREKNCLNSIWLCELSVSVY